MSMYEALAMAGPPKGYEILDAVMREVWTEEQTRYAGWCLSAPLGDGRPPTIAVARVQGEVYHWVQEEVPELVYRTGGPLIAALDVALSGALRRIPPMSVSDALQLGEKLRCQRRRA